MFSVKTAAAALGSSPETVRQLCQRGMFPNAERLKYIWHIPDEDIAAFRDRFPDWPNVSVTGVKNLSYKKRKEERIPCIVNKRVKCRVDAWSCTTCKHKGETEERSLLSSNFESIRSDIYTVKEAM